MNIDAYCYPNNYDIMWSTDNFCDRKANAPMNKKIIKLHKGVDNRLNFRIRDQDLKAVDVRNFDIRAKLINVENRELVINKLLCQSSEKNWVSLSVLEGDLVDVAPGFYELVIQAENRNEYMNTDYFSVSPFYNNESGDIVFAVEVTAHGDTKLQPSVEISKESFTYLQKDYTAPSYYTSAIPCNAIRNHRNSVHTFCLYGDNFSGTVEVLGSLSINPPDNLNEYFPVQVEPGTNVLTFEHFTGIEPYTFRANLMWVKFRITDDTMIDPLDRGELTKIIWRS